MTIVEDPFVIGDYSVETETDAAKRVVRIHISGPMGAGKTVLANILRYALSEDPQVKVIFDKSVGLMSDKTVENMTLEPMTVYVKETQHG